MDDDRLLWLVGAAPLTDDAESVEILMEVFSGTDFGQAFSSDEVQREGWGTIIFSFPGCVSAKVDYSSDLVFGQGSVSLTRLTHLAGLSCSAQ